MNILIIDCSAGMSVYLCKDKDVFSFVDENQKKHTDELLVSVDNLLVEAGLKVSEIDVVAVCKGPGSFTGIRVAISICKGLAVESKIKVVEVSNFDIFNYGIEKDSIFVLEGFSEFVYVRKNINEQVVDACENLNEFVCEYNDKFNKIDIFVANEKMQNKLKLFEIDAKIAKNNTILCVKDKIEKNLFVDLNSIEPVYLRASQAEVERNKKLGK